MKKLVSISLIMLCLIFPLFSMARIIFVKADTDIIHVPTEYPTIQEAINHANPGDTIFVHQGVYYENIVANKSVSLVGEDKNLTIIDGNWTSSVIFILANDVSVKNFTLRRSGRLPYDNGVCIERSNGNVISNNIISDNYDGLSLFSSSNNVISGNVISDNHGGLSLFSSSNNVISGNVISDNHGGLSLFSSGNNVISRNAIALNVYSGISILYSINNIIYRNNFNNTVQVQSASINIWNYDFEGNYWSDYVGQDMNGDGIGDNPHVIDGNNQDDYPLMGMFSHFEVSLIKKVYEITIISNSTISDFKFEVGLETGNKIIRFNVISEYNTTGFCRVMIPTELMNDTFVTFVGEEEINPVTLEITNETYVYLYFTYNHTSQVVTIISSKTRYLYNELLLRYAMLQADSYNLNLTYYELLDRYDILLFNYTQLLNEYNELNASYQKHLIQYNENMSNFQNLIYVFASLAAIFVITTVYLSKHVHVNIKTRA